MTVLCLERHPVDQNRHEAFQSLIADVLGGMRRAPGILWADAARASDDEPSFLVLSEWRTAADADAWEASDQAVSLSERIDPLLRSDVTKRRFSSDSPGVPPNPAGHPG